MSVDVDYVTFSNLIIDDIVFPDGRTSMNVLGGAGTHALVGMRVWNANLGYCAMIGSNLDEGHRTAMQRFGIDLQGLVRRPNVPQARAWQLFEPDERRIEIFRTDLEQFQREQITPEELPPAYHTARGFHLQWGTLAELRQLVSILLARNPDVALALEPNAARFTGDAEKYRRLLPKLALFSPDREEAEHMTGHSQPADIFAALLNWGAPVVALRMGAEGSWVMTQKGQGWRVPAPPTTIVDVTGAGNSYVGGFLTGLGDGLPPLEAALRATVSASFTLEQFGLPAWHEPPAEEVSRRLAWARERIEEVS